MSKSLFKMIDKTRQPTIEPLEQRIAPALTGFAAAVPGSVLLQAGTNHAGLSIGGGTTNADGTPGIGSGAYFLYVQKGEALVFITDLNNNGLVDFNEITGIAAGNGLQLISFVDIHGDIMTNLNADGTLTDSDNNATNGRDGKVLLNSQIDTITLRKVTTNDITSNPDSTTPQLVLDRTAPSNFSIFGNIYAGKGFGSTTGGLIINSTGATLTVPSEIGSIRVGSAASNQHFNFGATGNTTPGPNSDIIGEISPFITPSGQNGADIIGVHSVTTDGFNMGTLQAGNGGFNGRGGDVMNVHMTGDKTGGYGLIGGNAGAGSTNGPRGGSIVNFTDDGSVTSQVLLQTGDGGRGLLGAGGAAGTLGLDPTSAPKINGRVVIHLGNGGDGFTAGAAGGTIGSASFSVPEGDIPTATSFVATTRAPGDIGQTMPFDFNGSEDVGVNRYSDAVYTTNVPGQLVVVFGGLIPDPFGGTPTIGFDQHKTIYLNGPNNAQALTVADVNGDGHPDILVASADQSSAGISVFLSHYDPANGKFIGFSDALRTPLPQIDARSVHTPVLNIAVGDFDHDPNTIPDIAVTMVTQTPATNTPQRVVLFLKGEPEPATIHGSGYFYADFPSGLPYFLYGGGAGTAVHTSFLRATSPKTGDTTDFVVAGLAGGPSPAIPGPVAITYDGSVVTTALINLGDVDTNRKPNSPGKTDNQSFTHATVLDFAVLDINGDGNTDLVFLTKAPEGFFVTFTGDGADPLPAFGVGAPGLGGGDNSGIKISGTVPDGGLGIENQTFVGILPTNADGTPSGTVNDVAIVDYASAGAQRIWEITFPTVASAALAPGTPFFFGFNDPGLTSIQAYDTYTPQPLVPDITTTPPTTVDTVGYVIGDPYTTTTPIIEANLFELVGDAPITDFNTLTHQGFDVSAGHGGNSLIGAGGAGGILGTGTLTAAKVVGGGTTTVGSLQFHLPTNILYFGELRFLGGTGGSGYTNGGAGGNIQGITVDSTATLLSFNTILLAGDGGMGLTGTGGTGGTLRQMHIQVGEIFVAGSGGAGVFGGAGGSVIGNTISTLSDTSTGINAVTNPSSPNTQTGDIVVRGGTGAHGVKRGGNGGDITGFQAEFLPPAGGFLDYRAGDGGDALSGVGGTGGKVASSSAVTSRDFLAGDIFLSGGEGGRGLTGGGGGSVSAFENSPSGALLPASLTVLGGNGGIGTGSNGGAGGAISNLRVASTGTGILRHFDFSDPASITTLLDAYDPTLDTPLTYNRVIAGNGGDSFGATGGIGGSISTLNTIATQGNGATAVVAGKGGDGLAAGALGGSVSNATVDGAPGTGKILVIAGDGGSQFGSLNKATPTDPFHFGGNGPGGNGGSITNFSQPVSVQTHTDLIAGSGGNTINHGSTLDSSPSNVGRGGSITNANASGSFGNTDSTTAIRSYNAAGQRIADFVATQFVTDPPGPLNDTVGNVGIVVGAAGRVRDNNNDGILDAPAGGVNGSLTNVHARNIMSAVAGNVDSIASIQSISNVGITINGGVFGADKTIDSFGRFDDGHLHPYIIGLPPDYLSVDDSITGVRTSTPLLGGKLVDGAIIGANSRTLQSDRDFILG